MARRATAAASKAAPPAAPPELSLRERKHQRMRKVIIDCATRLFETKGYSSTTLKDIADDAETSVATIMRYFGGKDAILLHKERSLVGDLRTRMRANAYASLAEGVRDMSWRSGFDLEERDRLYHIIMSDAACVPLLAVMRQEWEVLLEELYLRFSPDTSEARLRAKSLAMMQTALGMAGSAFYHADPALRGTPFPMQSELIEEFIGAFVKPIDRAFAARSKSKRG